MIRRFCTLVIALTTPLVAQAPSAWTVWPAPGGVNTSNIHQRGKILAYRDGNTVRAFSSMTRAWESFAVSSTASLRIANDLLLIEDGTRLTAFASYSGTFASITVGVGATIVNPLSQTNDSIVVVQDGTRALSVSGFVGRWESISITANARIAVQRHAAVIADGNQLHGMGAFRGTWATRSITAPATSVLADGTLGVATGNGEIHAFSALRQSWQTTSDLVGNTQFSMDDDVAVWWDGVTYLGFSGPRGTFSRVIAGTALNVEVNEQVVVAHDKNLLWFFSGPTATWTNLILATTPKLTVSSSLVVAAESQTAHAFSAPRGTVSSTTVAANWTAASASVASVLDTSGKGVLFSAVLGTWTPLPNDANAPPRLANTGAIVPTTTGVSAYSARTGTIHAIPISGPLRIHTDGGSALLVVDDSKDLLIFEPRRETWLRTPLSSPAALVVHIWRTNMVAVDGNRAIGYGALHGRVETRILTGSVRESISSSESGRVITTDAIAAFSSMPLLSTPWQYPEFRRTFATGADLDLHLSAPATTGRAYLSIGIGAPFALPALGDVFLEPTLLIPISIPMDARNGTARESIFVPDLPGLKGIEVFMQALIVPTAGNPYLSDLASVRMH